VLVSGAVLGTACGGARVGGDDGHWEAESGAGRGGRCQVPRSGRCRMSGIAQGGTGVRGGNEHREAESRGLGGSDGNG
jgi:hypothetical protein